jgi:polysaccharide biosynthesis/export protein
MTITPTSILKTLVLAGLVVTPLTAAAQTRSTSPAPATRPAPAPAPRTAPAPAPAQTATSTPTAPAPVGTSGTAVAAAPAAATVTGIRPWNEQDYRVGPGDKLRVEVYGEPQLSQSLQVRPDGKITLTLVGDVLAAGRTPIELRDSLTTSFKSYVNNPAVTVIVQDAIANQIVVSGEVGSPGQQVLLGPITILEAIAKAGGPGQWAKTGDIYVLRKTAKGVQKIDAQYKDALKGKTPPMVLQPGDTVVVP